MHRPPIPGSRRAEIEGLTAIGVAILMGFAGAFLFALSLGLVEADDRPGVFARLIMFCFGGIMLGTAGFVGWRITAEVVELPPRDLLGITWRVATRTLARIDPHSLIATAFLAPLVWAFLTPDAPVTWWRPSADALIALIPLEFLVIHGFPFLVLLAVAARGSTGWPRRWWIGLLVVLLSFYGALAWQEAGGLPGLFALLWLVAPNVFAFLKDDDAWHLRVAAATRWLLRLVVFFGLAIVLDERSLRGEGNLRLGAAYFSAILLLELFRIFELPVDIAGQWSRIPAARRSALLPPSA